MKDFRDYLQLLVCCQGTLKLAQACRKNSVAISSTLNTLQIRLLIVNWFSS